MQKRGVAVAGVALLAISMLATWGCSSLSEMSPTGPGSTGGSTTGQSEGGWYAEAFIQASAGGSVILGQNKVYFPPNALASDTLVSITREGTETVFDLGPDGTQFLLPVTLTLEMAATGGLSSKRYVLPVIWYYNEGSRAWVSVGGAPDWSNRTISTPIMHFSRYGTGSPWGG